MPGLDRRPRALLVQDADVRHYPPMYNAAEILAERGFAVEIVHRRSEDEDGPYPRGAGIHAPAARGGSAMRELRLVYRAVRVARHFKPDVIIGYDFRGAVAAAITRTFLALSGRRPALVYHNHDAIDWSKARGLRRAGSLLEGGIARAAQLVVIPDGERATWFAAMHHLNTRPSVSWNCPRLRTVSRSTILREHLDLLGHRFDNVVIRQQARIGSGHAIEATIKSIPLWPPQSGLVLIGRVDPIYKAHLKTIARDHEVEAQLVFLPPVPYVRILELVSGADIGLALYEPVDMNRLTNAGASNKLFEYIAAGLPVIASDFPGFVQLVEPHNLGVCVNPADSVAIATAIRRLLGGEGDVISNANTRLHQECWNYEAQYAGVVEHLSTLAMPCAGTMR